MSSQMTTSDTKARSNLPVVIASLVGIALLLGLGTWQVMRLQWKERLIEARASAITANPISMSDIEAAIEHGYDADFYRVRMTGRYIHDETRYVYRPRGKRAGLQVVTPFLANSGFIVLVDRGFIDEAMLGSTQGWRMPQGEVTVTGVTRNRARDRNMFSPDADLSKNVWYWYDLPGIVASLPPSVAESAGEPAPITSSVFVQIEPGGEPGSEKFPDQEDLKVELPNNHLQYALTWYSLAIVLAVMSWLFIRRRKAEAAKPTTGKNA